MKRGDVADALEKVNTSLRFNASNPLAMGLKALALANSGQKKAALEFIFASLEQYPLSYPLHCARWMIERSDDARNPAAHHGAQRVNASLLAGWLLYRTDVGGERGSCGSGQSGSAADALACVAK